MRTKLKLLFAATMAILAITAITSTATAASFSISPGGAITATSQGLLSFEETTFGFAVTCLVTLNGSLHRGLIEKALGTLIGFVTGATVSGCNGGDRAEILSTSLPWHITYEGISGTLPSNVTAVNVLLRNTSFLIFFSSFNSSCLYRGNAEGIIETTGRGPFTTGLLRSNINARVPIFDESLNRGITCPGAGRLKGAFNLTKQTLIRL